MTFFWIVIGVIIVLSPFVGIFIAWLLRPKSNIDLVITRTFLGSDSTVIKKGSVETTPEDTHIAMYYIIEGWQKKPIGTFHQKYLRPSTNGRFVLALEEWDIGRYRPLIYGGVIKEEDVVFTSKMVPQVGEDGKIITNWLGKPVLKKEFSAENLTTEARQVLSVSNDDFDLIVSLKERAREIFAKKEQEKSKWLPYILGGGLALFITISIIVSAYYTHESSVRMERAILAQAEALQDYNPAAQTREILGLVVESLQNQTVRELVPVTPEPPKDRPPT